MLTTVYSSLAQQRCCRRNTGSIVGNEPTEAQARGLIERKQVRRGRRVCARFVLKGSLRNQRAPRNGKPRATGGRKARGLTESARLPKRNPLLSRTILNLSRSGRLPVRASRWLGAMAITASFGCTAPPETSNADTPSAQQEECEGANLAGANLAGSNLAGSNLAGTNLAGANLGGNNLAGNNLAGSNLAGTNLAGNNLAGSNLAGSNLAGSNLAGSNLAGSNLAGSNLAGSNLAGSNLAGTNLAGNNLAGTNLSGTNLAGSNSGWNIHNLS